MTYKLIYDNFLIEYDKAGVSSSYPSLTIEEIAALLNKAMFALIALKVTGNNPRKSQLDIDAKGMADILPLIENVELAIVNSNDIQYRANNEWIFKFTSANSKNETVDLTCAEAGVLYLLDGRFAYNGTSYEPITIIPRVVADKFRENAHNKPWIKSPVAFMYNDKVHILADSDVNKSDKSSATCNVNVIKQPTLFSSTTITTTANNNFVLSNTMCEELISLAVIFACKTVENPRVTTEIQTKSLEA